MRRYSHEWSALIIALVTLTFVTMMSIVFLERLYRFNQASEWIENSNVAYYYALGAIEKSLFWPNVNKYSPWNVSNITLGNVIGTGMSLTGSTGGTIIPQSGKGTSPYNTDYNIIAIGQPIQLVIPEGVNWSNVAIKFRVPSISNSSTGTDPSVDNSGIVLWTFASSGASLFASGEANTFRGYQINSSNVSDQRIASYNGTTNSGSVSTFGNFYTIGFVGSNGANCAGYKCTLKLSMIRPVPLIDGRTMPFLEYQIDLGGTIIPSQYMTLEADWYANGFLRSKSIQFPQITTNTALDFAVLQ